MTKTLAELALIAATLTTGLAAGLFAAFGYAVMPGLRRVDDRSFVTTLRAINVAIRNGWTLLILGGALLFTLVAAVLRLVAPRGTDLAWTLAALALYIAALAITVCGNVPLNDRLAASLGDDTADRTSFERPWTRWNHLRTGTSIAAFGCLVAAVHEG